MTQDSTEARYHHEKRFLILIPRLKEQHHKKDGDNTLCNIHQKHSNPCPLSQSAKDIGTARIPGSLFKDIDSMRFRIEIAVRNITEEIADDERNDTFLHGHLSFLLLSL